MVELTSFKLWVFQIVILSGLLVFFIWLGIRPRNPRYTMTDCSVQNSSIAFGLEIENPNKDSSIYFNDINLTFYNNQDSIGSANISGFSQDKEETTPRAGSTVVNGSRWRELEDQISNRTAQLRVVLLARLRYRTWGIKGVRHKMHLNGELPLGSDGKLPGKIKLHKA